MKKYTITDKEVQKIIQEETMRYKKRMMLEAERDSIVKQLQEMEECDMMEEDSMDEGMWDKVKQFMGTGMDVNKATQMFTSTYASTPKHKAMFQNIVTQLGSTPEVMKAAIIRFIMENGGLPILSGAGKNAEWDAATSSFKRLAGGLGGGNYGQVGG